MHSKDNVFAHTTTTVPSNDEIDDNNVCITSTPSCVSKTNTCSIKCEPSELQSCNFQTATKSHDTTVITSHRNVYTSRRRVQDMKSFKCSFCDSSFVHYTHLRVHERTHTGEKPHQCQFCSRSFAQKGNLRVHEKIHTGEKNFGCEYCSKAFITNAQLLVHMQTHINPNKKRGHGLGRPPSKEANGLKKIKKPNNATENDSDLASSSSDGVSESMKQILDQLAAAPDTTSAVSSTSLSTTTSLIHQQKESIVPGLFRVVTPQSSSKDLSIDTSTTAKSHHGHQNLTSSSPQQPPHCRDFQLQHMTFQNVTPNNMQHITVDSSSLYSNVNQASFDQGQGNTMQNSSLYTHFSK